MRQVPRFDVQLAVELGRLQHRQRVRRQGQRRAPTPQRRLVDAHARHAQAFGHGQRFEDVGGLELAPEAEAHAGVRWRMRDVVSIDSHGAGAALGTVAHAAHQRGLAGAVGADQAHQFAAVRDEVDARQHLQAAEMLRHASQLDHRCSAVHDGPHGRLGQHGGACCLRHIRCSGAASPAQPPQQARQGRQQALRQQHDHQDEGHAEKQLPDEGQAAAQVGAAPLDQQRAEHRPDQGAAPAERDPDDHLGAEHEAGQLRRDHAAETCVAETCEAGDGGGGDQQHDLQAGRVDAQVGAARFVVANRCQQAPAIAPHEEPGTGSEQHEHTTSDAKPGLQTQVGHGVAGEARTRAGEGAAREQQLRHHDGQHQRNDRGI